MKHHQTYIAHTIISRWADAFAVVSILATLWSVIPMARANLPVVVQEQTRENLVAPFRAREAYARMVLLDFSIQQMTEADILAVLTPDNALVLTPMAEFRNRRGSALIP